MMENVILVYYRQQNETIQKYEQANKDAEFYHTEAESWRSR